MISAISVLFPILAHVLRLERVNKTFQQKAEEQAMKKTKHILLVITLLVAITLVGNWAFAGGRWGTRGHGYHGRGYGYHWNLSPEQRENPRAQQERFFEDPRDYSDHHGPDYGKGHMWRSWFGTMRGYGGRPCW